MIYRSKMRFLSLIVLLLTGCQQQSIAPPVGQPEPKADDNEVRSAASGDDVDPSYFRELPFLNLPWTITKETFGCNLYEAITEVGVLGDTSSFYMLVSVRTLSAGTQQLKISTYEKDGTWLAEYNRLEFCVSLVDTDETIDEESDCPVKLTANYSITVTDDLELNYAETQTRTRCDTWTKDNYMGAGAIVDGLVTDFSIRTSTEEDSTAVVN